MTKKIKSLAIQMLAVVVVFSGIVAIDQSNRAKAKASGDKSTPVTTTEDSTTVAGMSKALRNMLTNPKKVKKQREKVKSNKPAKVDKDDLYILAHVIDGEGRGQDDAFKWLVGAVVLNRVKADIYPNTIKEVVFQKRQYACTWDGNYDREPQESSWMIAEHLLRWGIKEEEIPSSVTGQSAAKQGKIWLEYKCNNGVTCYFCHNKYLYKEGE